MPAKAKAIISHVLDALILAVFLLIIFIIVLGGFSITLAGHEVSATSVYKPIGILLASFIVKLFVADFKQEFEKNKTLVMSTLLVMMLLCEVLSRIYYSVFVPQDLFWATENLAMKREASPDRLYGIDTIRLSKNKSITYELIPGIRGQMDKWPEGVLFSVNQLGFRDDEEKSYTKEEGKFRIVGVGGSVMLGQGVSFKDTYGEVIENELNQKAQKNGIDIKFEFINLGVGGYNTTMEVETFLQKGVRFNPDLAIISYAPDDFDLPNFIIKKESPWTSKKSFAVFYLNKRLEVLSNTKYGKFLGNIAWKNKKKDLGIWGLDMAMRRNIKLANPIGNEYELVPDDYKFMVGIEAYVREMKRLKEKCDELKIPLILSLGLPEETVVENRELIAIQTARELNIPVVKDFKEVREFLKERDASPEFFCVHKEVNDCHPNKWGHLIRGKKLASFIYANYISPP